jgi:hypothetical protein
MEQLKIKYNYICNCSSDINEQFQTLYNYARECESILDLGVRGVVSSYAFVYGLMNNNKETKNILLNDINECDVSELLSITKELPINVNYKWMNDLELDITDNVDLTFIDTWHVYGQLKRELNKFSKITNKYIIMQDTTIDEIYGETIRCKGNAEEQSIESGIPVEEINKGLWPAIEEFLETNKNWKIKERFYFKNGLTILEKV